MGIDGGVKTPLKKHISSLNRFFVLKIMYFFITTTWDFTNLFI